MEKEFNLEQYLTRGVEKVVKNIVKATLTNPRESLFVGKYVLASKKASERRHELEQQGQHIPPFLIASVTSSCNLHCAGCYARAVDSCHDGAAVDQLSAEEWGSVFDQAADMGIGFVLLIGGEPFVRPDVIRRAALREDILFPIFTNGTMMDEEYLALFDEHRNLVPILSIEGGHETTNQRRGKGIYEKLDQAMTDMRQKGIAFGASVTVTKENMAEVLSDEYVQSMYDKGCKAIIYVEYVPVSEASKVLALEDKEREILRSGINARREKHEDMLLVSFPGDEKSSGGCIAAGRGFFHINSHGGAEPCPFSPYSDVNIKTMGLKEALNSPLFKALQTQDVLMEDHAGGCVLYERKDMVEALLQGKA